LDSINLLQIANADMNFVVKVSVKNGSRASEKVPTFNFLKHMNTDSADFYQIYGDSYIANIMEGGEFIGILSVKTSSSTELMDIRAKLEGGFGGVQAKGAGAYSTSELAQMANMDVNVTWSGMAGVNPG
jgi:hypothetical protein